MSYDPTRWPNGVPTLVTPADLQHDEKEPDMNACEKDDQERAIIAYYSCPTCGEEWEAEWDSACNDDCPYCGTRDVEPYFHVEADDTDADTDRYRLQRLVAVLSDRLAPLYEAQLASGRAPAAATEAKRASDVPGPLVEWWRHVIVRLILPGDAIQYAATAENALLHFNAVGWIGAVMKVATGAEPRITFTTPSGLSVILERV